MKNLMMWLRDEESGQGMVEYGLILAGIAVVVIVAVYALGTTVKDKFNTVKGDVANPENAT